MRLRNGYTTGTCAQAAAKASAMMLATGERMDRVEVETPSGVTLYLPLIDPEVGEDYARCGVVKDAGDDPDVTHGARIYAAVRLCDRPGVVIKGGEGVGIVTRPGLAVPVGEYAINPTPKEMIKKEVSRHLPGNLGLEVIISVSGGEELAKGTYNPRLGIRGGISILGTTGIVEPKSMEAYQTSLALQLDVLQAAGYPRANLVLGYVGEKFCKTVLVLPDDAIIRIGDHVGFMLEQCAAKGIEEVLLVGHIGKLVKVANGQFDTHSQRGDPRIETIARHATRWGAETETVEAIRRETTAEATVEILRKKGLMGLFDRIAQQVVFEANELTRGKLKLTCIILSLGGEVLGRHPEGERGDA
jgi:cobalt-precorrin-5B (C1)-methyltransferase